MRRLTGCQPERAAGSSRPPAMTVAIAHTGACRAHRVRAAKRGRGQDLQRIAEAGTGHRQGGDPVGVGGVQELQRAPAQPFDDLEVADRT